MQMAGEKRCGRQKINLPVALDDVLARYEAGEQLPAIAQSIGLSERTLYRRLLENPDKWRSSQEAQAMQRYDLCKTKHAEAVANLEALKRQLDEEGITDAAARNWRLAHVTAIERACERMLNRAEWELERLISRLYGQKQEVSSTGGVSISISLNSAAAHIKHVEQDGHAALHISDSGESAESGES